MLVSTIIANGQSLADTPNTNFFTASDALFAVQLSWKQIYQNLCQWNDDYFVTTVYPTFSSFTPDANRQFLYNYALPSDFFHLRLFQYQPNSQTFVPVQKMTIEDFGNTQNSPAYRMMGTNLSIYTVVPYTNWCVFYYPAPATLTTLTDLVYPNTMIPEIMSYQLAVEIRRKQNLDTTDKQARVNELMENMRKQIQRDDSKAEPIKNVFAQGFWPYI